MNIPGCTYVTHKVIQREWGKECRITVINDSGKEVTYTIQVTDSEDNIPLLVKKRIDKHSLKRAEAIEKREKSGRNKKGQSE